MKRTQAAIFFVAIGALLGLGGCASTRIVDTEVQAFSSMAAVAAPPTYRFERLPSQQSYGEAQARLEKVVEAALGKQGLARVSDRAAQPTYTVQVGVRTQREPRAPWEDSYPGSPMIGRDLIVASNGQVLMLTPPPRVELPWYVREVSLLMRELSSNRIVYETHALHAGRWADSFAVLPAMFDAALSGFPNPPTGPRKINIEMAQP